MTAIAVLDLSHEDELVFEDRGLELSHEDRLVFEDRGLKLSHDNRLVFDGCLMQK
jgi:hypothetical protein